MQMRSHMPGRSTTANLYESSTSHARVCVAVRLGNTLTHAVVQDRERAAAREVARKLAEEEAHRQLVEKQRRDFEAQRQARVEAEAAAARVRYMCTCRAQTRTLADDTPPICASAC